MKKLIYIATEINKGYICKYGSHTVRHLFCRKRLICNSTPKVEQDKYRVHQDTDYHSSHGKANMSSSYSEETIHTEPTSNKRLSF